MEGIKISKPNTRPFERVILSSYCQEIFVHQGRSLENALKD